MGGGGDLGSVVQIERQPAGGAFVRAHALAQLHHGGEAQQRRRLGCVVRRRHGTTWHHRDAVRGQHRQRLVLHRGEPPAAADGREHAAHRITVRRHGQHGAVRQFARGGAVAAILHQMQEAAYRLLGRGEHRHAGLGQAAPARRTGGLAHGTDQQRHLHGVAGCRESLGRRRIGAAGRRLHHQDAADARCAGGGLRQRRQARRVIRLDVDDVGGQSQPVAQHRVGGHPAGADRVGDDAQCLAADRAGTGEDFGRGQQVVEIGDAQHARATQRGLEGTFRGAARVRQHATGPDRHHRPQPRCGAGGGEKRPPVAQLPDVEQDRAGARVAGQPVQHQAEADIGAVADADDVAEADAVRLRPVQHRAAQRCRLRHQSEPAGRHRQMRARGVQSDAGHRDAERFRAQHANAAAPRRVGQTVGATEDDGRESALGGQSLQKIRRWRGADHREVWRRWQCGDALRSIGCDHAAFETAGVEIGHHLATDLRSGADRDDQFRVEQTGRTEASGRLVSHQMHGGKA